MDGKFAGIPLEVIEKGRSCEDVLETWGKNFEVLEGVCTDLFGSEEDNAASVMVSAVYRIYLLGVEDGMKQ